MASVPVVFDKLVKNHPFHYEIYSKIDGEVAQYHPPCCIQVSYALNMAGAPIERGEYKVPEMGRKSRFFSDKSNRLYLIEVCDMGAYLNGRYGVAENHRGTTEQMKAAISGRKGIIRFGRDHIDIWEGDRFHQEGGPSMPDNWAKGKPPVVIWGLASVKSTGIYFWEANGAAAAPVDDPRCGWPTPNWLLGWWEVRWRSTSYYYLFEPNGRAKWSEVRPASKASNMTSVNDNGACISMGRNVSIGWQTTGTKEEFQQTSERAMKGVWNGTEPLTATKMW